MTKILHIARREFVATVMTRGFMIGLLLMPAVLAMGFAIGPKLMAQQAKPIQGMVAVVDPTGEVTGRLRDALKPEAVAVRRAAAVEANLPTAVRDVGMVDATTAQIRERTAAEAPRLQLVDLAGAAGAHDWLRGGSAADQRLAVIVVKPNAVRGDQGYGSYDLFLAPRVDPRVEGGLYDGMRDALIAARTGEAGLARDRLDAVMTVARPRSTTVTASGDSQTDSGFAQALPFVFIMLMFFGVMVGGQGLMTSTIEEKSSRVVEVLLSAVSPFELMAGKLLGQLAVSAVTLALYIGLGLVVLSSLTMLGLVQPMILVYLVVFFVVTYATLGALMAAIGAAVNEMREAQSLMTPITLMIILPSMFAAPILRNPSSTFATVISFVPPMNTFAMLMRITSSAPPPAWQIWLTVLVSVGAAFVALWFAGKVFKVGLLMFGKPPNLATLIKWARMA
jgi:ABC-2 type transport system permease protein